MSTNNSKNSKRKTTITRKSVEFDQFQAEKQAGERTSQN
jgi:hypothetical protein